MYMNTHIDLNDSSLLHIARTSYSKLPTDVESKLVKLIELAEEYPSALVTRTVTSILLGLKESTLAQWACIGKGLPIIKSGRRCYYRLSDIRDFLNQNTIQHTL